jgi:hypothetical protein
MRCNARMALVIWSRIIRLRWNGRHFAMKNWILTHATRVWTALLTLAGLGAAFVYRPDLLTLYLQTTMRAIERGTAALPYPWGDRLEVVLRGIGGSVWMQFAFAIVVVRAIVWLIARFIGYLWRRRGRDPVSLVVDRGLDRR